MTVVAPGYFAVASAGVAPLSTASVRAITTLVPLGGRAEAAVAAEPELLGEVLKSFALAHAEAVVTAYVRHAVPTTSERRKWPSAS